MGADKSTDNTPNASKFICSNCLPKPNRLGYLWKKASLGVHSPCFHPYYWFMFLFKNRIKKQTPELIILRLFIHENFCNQTRVELNLEVEFRHFRQFKQINFETFGVFSIDLSALILVLWVPCPCLLLINHYFYKKISLCIQMGSCFDVAAKMFQHSFILLKFIRWFACKPHLDQSLYKLGISLRGLLSARA